jgi:hypothetical protein
MRTRLEMFAVVGCLLLAGCSVQRSQQADDAQNKMIGMSKERVLACMGPPASRMAEGATEVWSYGSGDGRIDTAGAVGSGGAFNATSRGHYCRINVVISQGTVSQVNYSGPTAGGSGPLGMLLAAHDQCGYAVQNCLQ